MIKCLFILVDYIIKYVPDSAAVRAVKIARELCLAMFFIINKTDLRLDPYKDFNTILLIMKNVAKQSSRVIITARTAALSGTYLTI